jgi:type VI protein secretion system component VasA
MTNNENQLPEQDEETKAAIKLRLELFGRMRDHGVGALDELRLFLQAHESEASVSGDSGVPTWNDNKRRAKASVTRAMEAISAALVHVESVVPKK